MFAIVFFVVGITTAYKGKASQTVTFAVSILVAFVPEGVFRPLQNDDVLLNVDTRSSIGGDATAVHRGEAHGEPERAGEGSPGCRNSRIGAALSFSNRLLG
jgi:hypothetical protein